MAVRPDATTKSAAPLPANSEDDLEQYGVWVKAEPQDIVEEPEALHLENDDFSIPLDSPPGSPAEESFLTEDEEKLLGSFDELYNDLGSAQPGDLPEEMKSFSMDDGPSTDKASARIASALNGP